jgi:hypothetical protein
MQKNFILICIYQNYLNEQDFANLDMAQPDVPESRLGIHAYYTYTSLLSC